MDRYKYSICITINQPIKCTIKFLDLLQEFQIFLSALNEVTPFSVMFAEMFCKKSTPYHTCVKIKTFSHLKQL